MSTVGNSWIVVGCLSNHESFSIILCNITIVNAIAYLFMYVCMYVGIVPVLRMSPAPGEQDLSVMDDKEGICDLYDIDHTNGLD